MKLNCAEFYSKEPTEEMIVDLVRNNAKRGEFMILEADDGEAFVQIAGEYDAANQVSSRSFSTSSLFFDTIVPFRKLLGLS